MNEPKEITAGFQYSWTESLSDYPADNGWVLKYILLNASNKIEFESIPDNSSHLIELTPETTDEFIAGVYTLYKYVEHTDGRKFQITSFSYTINASPISATTLDTRTHARKMLEALEALELGRASVQQKAFSIAGRSIEYLTPEEIIKWKNHYQRVVFAEENKSVSKRRLTQFTNPY